MRGGGCVEICLLFTVLSWVLCLGFLGALRIISWALLALEILFSFGWSGVRSIIVLMRFKVSSLK